MLAVDRRALALPIGAVGPPHVRPLVPVEAQPAQSLEDHALALGVAALPVGVFDAEDELAAVAARQGQVEEGDVGGAHVGISRGTRGDARARGGHGVGKGRYTRPSLPCQIASGLW